MMALAVTEDIARIVVEAVVEEEAAIEETQERTNMVAVPKEKKRLCQFHQDGKSRTSNRSSPSSFLVVANWRQLEAGGGVAHWKFGGENEESFSYCGGGTESRRVLDTKAKKDQLEDHGCHGVWDPGRRQCAATGPQRTVWTNQSAGRSTLHTGTRPVRRRMPRLP